MTDTDARNYQHKDPVKFLADHEEEKKRPCQELRKDLTIMVYSIDEIEGRETNSRLSS